LLLWTGSYQQSDKNFDVIADMIQNSAFKSAEIKKETGIVIDELNDINDNPEELIFDKFEEILFAGNSLSMPIIGTEKNIGDSHKRTFLLLLIRSTASIICLLPHQEMSNMKSSSD